MMRSFSFLLSLLLLAVVAKAQDGNFVRARDMAAGDGTFSFLRKLMALHSEESNTEEDQQLVRDLKGSKAKKKKSTTKKKKAKSTKAPTGTKAPKATKAPTATKAPKATKVPAASVKSTKKKATKKSKTTKKSKARYLEVADE